MSGKVVLLVDDDNMIRAIFKETLLRAGIDVIEANSADQALEQLAEGTHIDAVISDYRMPGMNGIELANSLQGQYPLMLISADNLQDVVGKIPVITKYKRKPLAPEEFLDEVKMLFACADPV